MEGKEKSDESDQNQNQTYFNNKKIFFDWFLRHTSCFHSLVLQQFFDVV